jgi:hypothetical protein
VTGPSATKRGRSCKGGGGTTEIQIRHRAAVAGFVDTHAAAIAVASFVASGTMSPADAIFPILAGPATDTIRKILSPAPAEDVLSLFVVIPGFDRGRVSCMGWRA